VPAHVGAQGGEQGLRAAEVIAGELQGSQELAQHLRSSAFNARFIPQRCLHRVHGNGTHGKILGGGMVDMHAGEKIGEIALAIDMGADAVGIGKSIHFPSHRPQGLAPKKTIF
jgi:pyruvate/2-oxoglutarate dehydrogenase complex dihydrolipoamide dehydrogenase (E3) component